MKLTFTAMKFGVGYKRSELSRSFIIVFLLSLQSKKYEYRQKAISKKYLTASKLNLALDFVKAWGSGWLNIAKKGVKISPLQKKLSYWFLFIFFLQNKNLDYEIFFFSLLT